MQAGSARLYLCAFSGSMIGCFKKGLCKVLRIEAFKIVFSFSQADPFDRDMELFINGKDDAALGCSVKLCQDDACQRNDFTKIFCLADSILPCRCIKDKKRLMRSIRNDLLDDTADLCRPYLSGLHLRLLP